MEKREEARRKKREEKRPEEEVVGGGPESPGGDVEPSNIPGEAAERGMQPPNPEPIFDEDEDSKWDISVQDP